MSNQPGPLLNIARIDNESGQQELEYSFHNGLGHLMASTSESGELTTAFTYGPFGEVIEEGGEVDDHLRRFNGKEADQVSRLNYYGYRYYDPLSLTWTQADPLFRIVPDLAYDQPRRMSLYTFSLNNPVRYMNPDGRNPAAAGAAAEVIGAALGAGAVVLFSGRGGNEAAEAAWRAGKEALKSSARAAYESSPVGLPVTGLGPRRVPSWELPEAYYIENAAARAAGRKYWAGVMSGVQAAMAENVAENSDTADTGQDESTHRNKGKKAADSGKNDQHGDSGRALDKADKQIAELQTQLENTVSRGEKKKIKQRIKNIRQTAQKKKKGTNHSGGGGNGGKKGKR